MADPAKFTAERSAEGGTKTNCFCVGKNLKTSSRASAGSRIWCKQGRVRCRGGFSRETRGSFLEPFGAGGSREGRGLEAMTVAARSELSRLRTTGLSAEREESQVCLCLCQQCWCASAPIWIYPVEMSKIWNSYICSVPVKSETTNQRSRVSVRQNLVFSTSNFIPNLEFLSKFRSQ